MTPTLRCLGLAICAVLATWPSRASTPEAGGKAWLRHTIDDSSLGPDGVRMGDIDADRRVDVVAPWEQGGKVMVYLNPGHSRVRDRWPRVVVGEVGDPEDAVFVDLDGDGVLDVVSACEGQTRTVFVHWAPGDRSRLAEGAAWHTQPLGDSAGRMRWMFLQPLQVDGVRGIDLVAGGRGSGAEIGWFQSPPRPRETAAWKWHALYAAGWIMTLQAHDMDGDGDLDIVASDRTGARRGVLWLENPQSPAAKWKEHRIGPVNEYEAMHLTIRDFDRDGLDDVIVAVKGGPIQFDRRTGRGPADWETHFIPMPANSGTGKAVAVADVNQDGVLDLVVTCEHAIEGKIGVFWMTPQAGPTGERWSFHSISGPEGFIFDLLQLVDLDGDGDLDVITEEEKGPYLASGYVGRELGVVWYENPAR